MSLFRGLFVRKDSTRGTTPVEARKALAGLVAPLGAVGARPGLLSGGNVAGTAGWAYSVPAFHAVLTRGAADGVVLMGNDGPITAATDPAPATGARIDIVYLRHADVDAGDPTSAPAVDVAKGAASGAPIAPSLPAGALELARATVSSGATSTQHAGVTIAQTAQRTAVRGAPVPVRNLAEAIAYRTAHTAAGGVVSAASPLFVQRADGRVEVSEGGDFRSVAPIGGIFVGELNSLGLLQIPHSLGYVPRTVNVTLGLDLIGGTVGADVPRDYAATVNSFSDTWFMVRITNLRVSTWAGLGLRVAVFWSVH